MNPQAPQSQFSTAGLTVAQLNLELAKFQAQLAFINAQIASAPVDFAPIALVRSVASLNQQATATQANIATIQEAIITLHTPAQS